MLALGTYKGACFNASNDKGKRRQIITDGDSLPDALDDSTRTNKKHRRQSLLIVQDTHTPSPMEELPKRPEQPSMSSYKYTEVSATLQFLSHMLVYPVNLSWGFTIRQYFAACLL